ncbi:MAG TPA: SAM-dependent chlorinase/fluorinase [Planctomycetota bacterium]
MRQASVVALLTDFGLRDPYVGVMKGVILTICPGARIVDLCHEIPPQDVATASRLLAGNAAYFPEGTVFVAIVDPGVGSDRAAVAVSAGDRYFVGPDNGILGRLDIDRAVRVENRAVMLQPVSRTFHGRDVFAPAAAHLARGVKLDYLGPKMDRLHGLDLPEPRVTRAGLVGEVVWIDHFGNLITNIPADRLKDGAAVRLGRRWVGKLVKTYASVKPGDVAAVVGSSGTLEIAVRDGDARRFTGAAVGAPVLVTLPGATS